VTGPLAESSQLYHDSAGVGSRNLGGILSVRPGRVTRMTMRVRNLTFDCADAMSLARFWSAMTGWNVYYDDDPEVVVAPTYPNPDGIGMLFIPVPEGKTAKNRLHFDLEPTDCSRDDQVSKAVELGAEIIGDHRSEDGSGWVTLADPEGNEFCVERSEAERTIRPGAYRIGT
jgi:predicted enzyme related to lactoylglutathione lyase